jgi:CheY-like chemotaxis protein
MSFEGEPLVILLVEDNRDHAELVVRGLQAHRVANRIHHVSDGEEALDYLFHRRAYADPKDSPRPHLVLLDLRLPKIDGLEVLKTLKGDESLRSIPAVVLTTSAAERDLAGAYESYVNSYLVKPVDWAKFAKVIEDLGFYWLAWNRVPRT